MGLCTPGACTCAIQSESLQISGNGSAGNPYNLESTGLTIVTSVTRPGSPFLGQQILETDTDRIYYWDGSDWRIERDPEPYADCTLVPGVTTDFTAGVPTLWHTLPDVVAPPWATVARATVSLIGFHIVTNPANFSISVQLDGANATINGGLYYGAISEISVRTSLSGNGIWDGLTPGATLTPTLTASRGGGTGALRSDSSCWITMDITWEEN